MDPPIEKRQREPAPLERSNRDPEEIFIDPRTRHPQSHAVSSHHAPARSGEKNSRRKNDLSSPRRATTTDDAYSSQYRPVRRYGEEKTGGTSHSHRSRRIPETHARPPQQESGRPLESNSRLDRYGGQEYHNERARVESGRKQQRKRRDSWGSYESSSSDQQSNYGTKGFTRPVHRQFQENKDGSYVPSRRFAPRDNSRNSSPSSNSLRSYNSLNRGQRSKRQQDRNSYMEQDEEEYLVREEGSISSMRQNRRSSHSSNSLNRRDMHESRSRNNIHNIKAEARDYHLEEDAFVHSIRHNRQTSFSSNSTNTRGMHKSRSRNSHYDEEDQDQDSRVGADTRVPSLRHNRQLSSSSNSLNRRDINQSRSRNNRRSSYHEEEDDDDYLVGEEVHLVTSGRSTRQIRRQSTLRSNNSSYNDLYDKDSDPSEKEFDTWSMAKSAFSTLPDTHQKTFDIYYNDDDTPSLSASSRGNTSYSSRHRPVSRSSSFQSQLSQRSSQQSSFRSQSSRNQSSRKQLPLNSVAYDESDLSMGSILSGIDGDEVDLPLVVDSTSLLSEGGSFSSQKRKHRKNIEGRRSRDVSPNSDKSLSKPEYPLFDLDGLEIEIEVSDNEASHDSDEASRDSDLQELTHDKIDSEDLDRPWWIQQLEDEGLFEFDTSTVYATKMPSKHQFGRDIHHTLAETLADTGMAENSKSKEKEDSSDTSTVGVDDDVGDWEERLWSLARKYYKDYCGKSSDRVNDGASGSKSVETSTDENGLADDQIDEASIKEQEQLFSEEFESEKQGVLMFRSLLMACIKAYVEAFHSELGQPDDPIKRSSEFKLADDEFVDAPVNLDVNRYVPLVTARDLFEEVIKMVDGGTISLAAGDANAMYAASLSAKKRAELIVTILVEGNLHIFRRYQVITVQESIKLTSVSKQPQSRKLLSKSSAKVDTDVQTELDKYLYGDMYEEEKKEEDDDDFHDLHDTVETQEYEIRIRSAVIKKVLEKAPPTRKVESVSWAIIVGRVILSNIKGSETEEPESQNWQHDEERSMSHCTLANSKHAQPLAELYCLRYAPTFLLRSLTAQKDLGGENDFIKFADLTRLLTNKVYIRRRFELQGPFNATLSHLSNFHDQIVYHGNMERCKQDDSKEYMVLHDMLVSVLYSHLETTLKNTGYQLQQSQRDDGGIKPAKDEKDDNINSESITIGNYAKVVAICLEVGRALHHLGLCLGRRQRDMAKVDRALIRGVDNSTKNLDNYTKNNADDRSNAVSLEIASYRHALDAYKACIYLFSRVEETALSEPSLMRGGQEELQQLREAKMSVELHLADTLTCLGFCHDTKLCEYDSALMAYRESLSLYIRHIGRFHTMVSNTLHNMGTIHVELKQWAEAASCYRQCLSIIKRKEEQEKSAWIKSHGFSNDEEDQPQGFVSSMNEDIACTLECLGSSLAMMEEYDASLVCLQQAIDRMGHAEGSGIYADRNLAIPSVYAGRLLSQAANLVMKQASELASSINWECHMMLFSGKNKIDSNLRFLLASHIKKEHCAKDFIRKAILARRHNCYVDAKMSVEISTAATSLELEAFACDLLTAGRLEFRERSYAAAISYFYEALIINLSSSQGIHSVDKGVKSRGLLVFDKDSLKAGEASLKVTDDVLGTIDLSVESCTAEPSRLTLQILSLIGISYTRINEINKAKKVLSITFDGAKALAAKIGDRKSALQEAIALIDVAVSQVRLSFIACKMGDSTSVLSLEQAIETFNAAAQKLSSSEDETTLMYHRQRLEIIINNGITSAWHVLGQVYMNENDTGQAMKYLEKTIDTLNAIHDTRLKCPDPKAIYAPLPFETCFFWEDPSPLSTATILSDTNQHLGQLSEDESFRLECYERAIGLREFFMSKLGSLSSVDNEHTLDCFDESRWERQNMHCYASLLEILENTGTNKLDDYTDEEKSLKSQNEPKSADMTLTKEDVLFRMGNLQAHLGLLKEAIKSFKEADDSTVERLGTKDHLILSNIKYNMGNAYRQLSLSSLTPEQKDFAKERAMACYSESIRISTTLYGNFHSSTAESIQNQGILYMGSVHPWLNIVHEEWEDEEDEDIAMDFLKESLRIRKKDKESGSNLEQASTLYFLGNLCLRSIGRNSYRADSDTSKLATDAINFLLESLKIRNLLLGEDHLDVVNTLQCLGQAYLHRSLSAKGNFTKANEDLVKALETLKSSLDLRSSIKEHAATPYENFIIAKAHCCYLLGHAEEARDRLDGAMAHFTSALRLLQTAGKQATVDISKDADGRHMMNIEAVNLLAARLLQHMALIHKKKRAFDKATLFLNKCVQIRSRCKCVKDGSLSNARIDCQLGEVFLDKEDADSSIEYFSRTLRTYLKHFGKDSLNVAEALFCMGKAFSLKARFRKSLHCYDKAMQIYEFKEALASKEKLGDIHREIGHDMMLSGGDLSEALEHYRSSVSFLEGSNSAYEVSSKLLTFYSEMLSIMRDVYDAENDNLAKSELSDEIGDVLHRMGNLFASSGEHTKAMHCFTEVLDIQKKRHTDREELRIADLLFNLGNIYVELKQPERALKCLEQSYDITKEALGNHKELHSTMYLMGVAFTELQDFDNALDWFSQALSVLQANSDDEVVDDAARGRTLYRLGQVCEQLEDNLKALSCFQDCAKLLKITRSNDLELSSALFSMGNLLQHNSDFERALSCYDQSLRIRLELGDHSTIAITKESIGVALSSIGEFDRALAFLADALRTKTQQYGCVNYDTGRALMHIGQNYLNQGLHGVAMTYFEAGLSVFQAEVYSVDAAVCLYNIGVIQDFTLSPEERSIKNYIQAIHIVKEYKAAVKTSTHTSGQQKYDSILSRSLHNAAKFYVQKKNYVDALQFMLEAFQAKKDVFGLNHAETAASQHWLGTIRLALGEDDLALSDFKGALKVRVSLFGTENKDVAETLYGLAEVHFKRDELPECLECINENLRLCSTHQLESDGSKLCRSKLLLGSCYQELGQYDQAKEHLLESLHKMLSVHGGARHLDIADAYFRLGICFCETNDYDESIKHFQKCLDIRTSMLGNLDIECANTYESIGIVQQKKMCHQEAISSFERALAIKKISLPEIDEDISVLLHFIGTSLFAIQKYDDALYYFKSSTDVKKKLHGGRDQEYAMSLLDQAAAFAKIGDDRRSMECYSESIESGGLPLDSWELGIAHKSMASYFHVQNLFESSFESYSEAISIFEWVMENEQLSTAKYDDVIECYVRLLEIGDEPISEDRGTTCYKLANCYVQVSKLQEAISMYREAIMIQAQVFGADHVSIANSLHNLGNCYRDYGDFEKSAECLTKALAILTVALGEEHEDVADTSHCLGVTLRMRSELQEAIPLFEKALAVRKKKLGPQHISTASTLYNLALLFQMKGSWNSAMKYCKEALRIQRTMLGDNNPITLSTLECAGRIHHGKQDYENAIKCFKSSFDQGNMMLLREIGLIYKDRGELDKATIIFAEAVSHVREVLGFNGADEDLLKSLHTRKQHTSEKDLIKLADDAMYYGSVLSCLDQFVDALTCFRFSNMIYQAKYSSVGSDHLIIAENLHRTGCVLEKLNLQPMSNDGLNDALDILTEALRIRKLHLVGSHPDLSETLVILAKVHHKLGNRRDALKFLTDAVESRGTKNAPFVDFDSLLQIGQMQKQYGRYQEALRTFEECLQVKLRLVGTRHSSIGELQFFMGDLLLEAGDFDSAESKFKEALEILEQTGSDIISVADVQFSMGILYTEAQNFSLALDCFIKSLQGRKLETLTTKVEMAELLNNIGICYCGMKEYDKAQVYHAEALESLIEELGYDHVDVGFCWHSLGTVHTELHDLEEALSCFKNAVKIERSELYLQSLGICLVKLNDIENAYVCLSEALQMKQLDVLPDDDMAEIQRHLGIIWMKREKYEDALAMFEKALKIKVSLSANSSDKFRINLMESFVGALESVEILYGSDHLRYAKLLHQKGNVHSSYNEHPLAIEAYIECLRIYKQQYGDYHLSVANTLFNLGVSLNAKGSPEKGIRCFVKALRISKAKLGEDHLDIADTYEQMAASNKLMMNYTEATNYFEKALNVRKLLTGGNELKSSTIMHEMGKNYCEDKNFGSAERAFKESLRIRTAQLGRDDILVAESMFHLGSLYKLRDDMTNALKCYEECLRINKSKSNVSNSHIADIFNSLGDIHSSLGNAGKSLCCFSKAISLYSEAYGRHDERVVSSLARKGHVYRSSGEYTNALSCFAECLELTRLLPDGCVSSLAEDRAYCLSQMGEIYSKTGDVTEASSHFALALAAYKQIFGPNNLQVASVLQNMAAHFVSVKEFERGYSCAKEALAMREKLLGKDDTETADTLYFTGKILFECCKYNEAFRCLERARRIHLKKLGKISLQVANDNFLLGTICERKADLSGSSQEDTQSDLDSAVQYLQDSLKARRELLVNGDPEIGVTLTRLGHVYYKLTEYDNSVDCFSESLKLRQANRDNGSATQLLVADSLFNLGTALNRALDTKRALQLFSDALKEYQLLLDKNDLNIAKCFSCIGEVHEKENDLSEAIKCLEKAGRIYEHNFGVGEPNEKAIKTSNMKNDYAYQAETLYTLATAHDRMGDEGTSLKLYRRSLKIYKSLFGRDSLQVAKVLNRLANMKGRTGSVEKAMVLFDESLRIRMLHLGNNHEDVAETLFGMGIVFEKRKNYPAAMKAYSDCLRIRSSRHGSDSMEVAQVVVNIGVVRGNKGDFSGALKSWNKALAIYRKHGLNDDDALVATVLSHQDLAANLIKSRGKSKK
ncbi:hypothetical protein HJC23_005785 [Cyclotella cryptica]|uniref:Anaphase-promoting complex subunit 5 domain-containing protein n=1 Tax=Cyclotella cryptica TaxID=29204 RepID=A0ABD3P945_9STRA|eukprot:CCRYP_016757-RA/>CCRYP_016757-RA protein AED:0.00 eAED:0.00 QI:95/1/1/1/0.83/0.71/7/870/4740